MTGMLPSGAFPHPDHPCHFWFRTHVGAPSPVQERVWPVVARGNHVLFCSPTGTGKTMAAFMVPLACLLDGSWEGGGLRVLYVSPLKALNNDIRRNLQDPLEGMKAFLSSRGETVPEIRVMTRSGDTPARERRLCARRPPEILITTPESLGVLLNQKQAPDFFRGLRMVILDEIHAVLESKRGSLLALMLEKLELFAPDFRRLGISATVEPPEAAARFLGGRHRTATGMEDRPVVRVLERGSKVLEIQVREARFRPPEETGDSHALESLGLELRKLVKERTRTLIFCNSRRTCETLARFINGTGPARKAPSTGGDGEPPEAMPEGGEDQGQLVHPHHGSLSRELRLGVEQGLKDGTIRGIVATGSLELGIDIGDLDMVVMVQSPASVSSALQRAGRSGHRLGETSRLRVYPVHGLDALTCAAMARGVLDQEPESLRIPRCPLDVLAQGILAFCLDRSWQESELLDRVRHAMPWEDLSEEDFLGVVDLLLGKWKDWRLKELEPRLVLAPGSPETPGERMFLAREGSRLLLFFRGGSIPARGGFTMRGPDGKPLGELDEEFVWERRKGDRFFLGNRVWEIRDMDDRDVHVAPSGGFAMLPFWRGEEPDMGPAMARRVLDLLDRASFFLDRGDRPGLEALLTAEHAMETEAASTLAVLLEEQHGRSGGLPGQTRMILEGISDPRREGEVLWVLQTFRGSRVNRPLAALLGKAWRDMAGRDLECLSGNEGILLVLPEGQDPRELLEKLPRGDAGRELRQELAFTPWFAGRFRENAGRALLLGGGRKTRTPLWLLRRRAAALLQAAWGMEGFPLIRETWRQIFLDELDLPALEDLLAGLRSGAVRVLSFRTGDPGRFASGLMWKHVNSLMYRPDGSEGGSGGPGTDAGQADLWSRAMADPSGLAGLEAGVVEILEKRLGPREGDPDREGQVADWLERSVWLTREEWDLRSFGVELPSARCIFRDGLVLSRNGDRLWKAFRKDPEDDEARMGLGTMLVAWLSCHGPRTLAFLADCLKTDPDLVLALLEDREEEVLTGSFTLGSRSAGESGPSGKGPGFLEATGADNLEYLHRLARNARRKEPVPVSADAFQSFLPEWQGMGTSSGRDTAVTLGLMRKLTGLALPAALWERVVWPSRFLDWYPGMLDALCLAEGLCWRGQGGSARLVSWHLEEDQWLLPGTDGNSPGQEDTLPSGKKGSAGNPGPWTLDRVLASGWPRGVANDLPSIRESLRQAGGDAPEPGELEGLLWKGVWEGRISHQDPGVLRKAVARNFRLLETGGGGESSVNRRLPTRREWENHRLGRGAWYPVLPGGAADALEVSGVLKERCRLVLDRYGVVFPALLERESAGFRWRDLRESLALMELSGEVLGGLFVEGAGGLQYALPAAWDRLSRGTEGGLRVLHAQDPACLWGTGLLPVMTGRRPDGWIVRSGPACLWIWHAPGDLDCPEPEHPASGEGLDALLACLDRMDSLRSLSGDPASGGRMTVRSLGGKPPGPGNPLWPLLAARGFRNHGRTLLRFRPA